jgi:hypothetical protein
MRKLITLTDMLGTALFLLLFTPAFIVLTVSFIPLALTLRLIRWYRSEHGA